MNRTKHMRGCGQTFEGSSECSVSAEAVWAAWTNPAAWQGGPVKAANIDADFVVGATITTKVWGYPPITSRVSHIDPMRMWIAVSVRPGLTMTMEHVIQRADPDPNTLVVERLHMAGALAGIAARLFGKRLESLLGATTVHIAGLAQARVSGQPQ